MYYVRLGLKSGTRKRMVQKLASLQYPPTSVPMKVTPCSTLVVLCLSFSDLALAAGYFLRDSVTGSQFLDAFTFQDIPDPTQGTVFVNNRWLLMIASIAEMFYFSIRNYVNASTAWNKGLVSYTENSFTARADHTTKLPADGPGRDSVRIRSKKTYTTHVVMYSTL